MSSKPSLRERKKERTRARLIEVSQRLFAEQGYDATTLEQICEEAEVSVSTLLLYFESKERLALTPDYDVVAEFRAVIEDPNRTVDTLAAWRAHVEQHAREGRTNASAYLHHYRFQASSPALVRGTMALLHQYEEIIAAGLARDHDVDPDDLTVRLMATTLVFGDQMAVRRWIAAGGKGDIVASCLAVVDFVSATYPKPGRRARAVRRAAAR
ncbi:MAG TPA: TetR/AcrR family transcriptional regulator [Acidimicrobiales bacterium]|nr:TetR/AcrR family transcriptional regulator [Acidimicrobiales bacterium]